MELFPLKKFDYESMDKAVINLTLLANDSIHTPTASIAVHILDRNDMVPKFNGTFDTNVKENVTEGTHIVQVRALISFISTFCMLNNFSHFF